MAYSPIAYTAANYRDYKFHWIKAYEPGTTTPKAMALFIDGSTQVSKLQINSDGFIVSAGSALVIPYINGPYDLWMFRKAEDADNNDTSNAVRLADNITAIGISSGSASDISETPPANPYDGARWTRCTDMKAFLWYVDADGGQWIEDRPSYGVDTVQNLTLPYEFETVAAMVSSTIAFPVGKSLHILETLANFQVKSGLSAKPVGSPDLTGFGFAELQSPLGVNAEHYGIKVTNTAAVNNPLIQSMIDENKGELMFFPDNGEGTGFLHSGIILDGSAYDNTKIRCDGRLKLDGDGSLTNFGGAWVGLILKDCENVELWHRGDGNRSVMIQREQIHMVGLAGARSPKIWLLDEKELRGDGMYVSQLSWTSDTAQTADLHVGLAYGRNPVADGRNLISIIACSGFYIGKFDCKNIGGTISGVTEPSGLDLEPNFFYQKITDGTVGAYSNDTARDFGLSILGREQGGDYNIKNITFLNLHTRGNLPLHVGVLAKNCERVTIKGRCEWYGGAVGGLGLAADGNADCNIDLDIYNCQNGAKIGTSDPVNNSHYNVNVRNYTSDGIQTTDLTNCKVTGSVYGATTASSSYAIRTRAQGGSVTQLNVRYKVDMPFDGNNARGFRNESSDAVSFTNCILSDCDMTGYSTFANAIDNVAAGLRRRDIQGVTEAVAKPTNGSWAKGDFVNNIGTIHYPGSNTIITGWLRILDGSGNALNTDWVQVSPKDN